MPVPEQEPVEVPGVMAGHDPDSREFSHPAYGQIACSRVSGSSTLYGSDFVHSHFMTVRISRSLLQRDLSRDWYSEREEIVEVAMSEAQWATFVSTPNVGGGVPCTIERVQGERMPSIPERRQQQAFEAELKDTITRAGGRVAATIAAIEGELGRSISAIKREAILEHLRKLDRELTDHLPFAAKSFAKHMENTVERAKTEVAAYVQQTVSRAGIEALRGQTPFLLKSGETPQEGG